MKIIVITLVFALSSTMASMARKYYKGYEVQDRVMIHVTPGISMLNYQSVDGHSVPTPTIGAGIEYAHFFGQHWGISVGAELSSFSSLYKFNDRKDSLLMYDAWSKHFYQLRQKLSTLEYQRVSYISLPVKLHYRKRFTKKLDLNLSAGAAYTSYLSENRTVLSGEIQREAFFDDINVKIDDYSPLMFQKYSNYIYPSSQPQFKQTILGIIQGGVSYNILPKWNLHTEINAQYGVENIKTRSINILVPKEYAGITATNFIQQIIPLSVGLRIGLAYQFNLVDPRGKCHCTFK